MAKVYVSSTIADLEAERRAVMEWLRAARHQAVDSYLPDSETVRDSCLDDIDGCDLYVLILGHRYGHQPDGTTDGLSITHLEFRRAGQSRIPRVALLRTSIPIVKLSDIENPERARLVAAFRAEVQGALRAAEFNDLQGLIQGLSAGVQHELEKLRGPSRRRGEEWLAAHLQHVGNQFTSHMASASLRPGASARDLYLDLLVRQRHFGNAETRGGQGDVESAGRPLEAVIASARSPVLVVGEGGAGKTTSLLYTAARLAERARTDDAAPVPIYVNLAKLTAVGDVDDLNRRIADSVPLVRNWDELADLIAVHERGVLFLLDSFNEIPEHLQRTGAVVLSRFVEKHQKNHQCLIASRLVPHIEQLAVPPSEFQTFEILRLTPDQVQAFLEILELGSLYERLPRELRDLAGNPFMLSAIAGTLAGKSEAMLPRNRGKLYQSFVQEWMLREGKKQRGLAYSFERVKEPLLAQLAKRMTAAGQTSLARTGEIDSEIEAGLGTVHRRIKRRGGMPHDWTVDGFLDETLGDGLLKRVNDRLHFMHQSVQEYFTSVYFHDAGADALVEFTPQLVWESVGTYALADPPNQRFVSTLLMLVGLLEDSTSVVQALASRNPVIAAAAAASSTRVDPALLARLEQDWIELLDHEDVRRRIIGCSCLVLASMRAPRVVHRLVSFATGEDFSNAYVGIPALAQLAASDATAVALVERAREVANEDLDTPSRRIAEAMEKNQSPQLVAAMFEAWRGSPDGSPVRRYFSGLLAVLDQPLLVQELERIRAGASDSIVAADAERAIAEWPSWQRVTSFINVSEIRRLRERAMKKHQGVVADALAFLRNANDLELISALRGKTPADREAAAALVAERRAPLGDVVLDSIVRFDLGWGSESLVAALVSACGETAAVAKLVEAAKTRCLCLGTLPSEVAEQLDPGELSDGLKAQLGQFVDEQRLVLEGREADADTIVWSLRPSGWGTFRPLYELRVAPQQVEIYDCNVAARAFTALTHIPGGAALAALRQAANNEDSEVMRIAIDALAAAQDPGLASRLLEQLKTATSATFIDAALGALQKMKASEALSLVEDVLLVTRGEWSDVHPVWGRCPHSPGWADAIHRILVGLDADEAVFEKMDYALASDNTARRHAALLEISRWLTDREVSASSAAAWATETRVRRVLDLALSDPSDSVRFAAGDALGQLGSTAVEQSLVDALGDASAEVRVAAGDVLVRIKGQSHYGRLAEVMRAIVSGPSASELRRRAGQLLAELPGGIEPFHQPIQAALGRDDADGALRLIAAAVDIFPSDVDLFWWRGHALRSQGALAEAAASFQHAAQLMKDAAVIPQTLAETFLELGDFPRAVEAARRGTELAVHDADAQSILALSCYKAGAIEASVEAAERAIELNPVQPQAIWVAVLAHLRRDDPQAARFAFDHARCVWQVLSPGFDFSFRSEFVTELDRVNTRNEEIAGLVAEIRQAVGTNARTVK